MNWPKYIYMRGPRFRRYFDKIVVNPGSIGIDGIYICGYSFFPGFSLDRLVGLLKGTQKDPFRYEIGSSYYFGPFWVTIYKKSKEK